MASEEINRSTPPEIFEFTGEWEQYEEALYKIFQDTIIHGSLVFDGLPIWTRKMPETKRKHFTFWHLVSEGEKEEERNPDLRRCERLSWVQWILQNYSTYPGISYWPEKRKRSKDYVFWYEEGKYVVVISKRSKYFLLKTAYYADKRHKILLLQKRRDENRKSPHI